MVKKRETGEGMTLSGRFKKRPKKGKGRPLRQPPQEGGAADPGRNAAAKKDSRSRTGGGETERLIRETHGKVEDELALEKVALR